MARLLTLLGLRRTGRRDPLGLFTHRGREPRLPSRPSTSQDKHVSTRRFPVTAVCLATILFIVHVSVWIHFGLSEAGLSLAGAKVNSLIYKGEVWRLAT